MNLPINPIDSEIKNELPINPFASEIKDEKRRRNQVYHALDYFLSLKSYYDFYSIDAFHVIQVSKRFAKMTKKDVVTSELLLLALFHSFSTITKTTASFRFSYDTILAFLPEISERRSLKRQKPKNRYAPITERIGRLFTDNFDRVRDFDFTTLFSSRKKVFIEYSLEVEYLIEKAVENAMTRFKTPVVTVEILFITLLEEKKTKAGKLLKRALKTKSAWLLLRYKFLKNLHYEESKLRALKKNDQYFACLMKVCVSPITLKELIQNNRLPLGNLVFRNLLIKAVLKADLADRLYIDIHKSIKAVKGTNKRKYSS